MRFVSKNQRKEEMRSINNTFQLDTDELFAQMPDHSERSNNADDLDIQAVFESLTKLSPKELFATAIYANTLVKHIEAKEQWNLLFDLFADLTGLNYEIQQMILANFKKKDDVDGLDRKNVAVGMRSLFGEGIEFLAIS